MQSVTTFGNIRSVRYRTGSWLAALIGMAMVLTTIGLYVAPTVGSYTAERFADPAMVQLAEKAGMSDHGRKLFLGTRPQLLDQQALAKACAGISDSPDITVLGCYDHSQNRIYLRDMDSRFDGVEVTTAAHEMLHVAYTELPQAQRDRVDELVQAEAYFAHGSELNDDMATYASLDADVQADERHAFIGSKYDVRDGELARHYASYFADRTKPIQANAVIETAFDELAADIDRRMAEVDRAEAMADDYYASHERAADAGNAYGAEHYYGLYENQYARLQQMLGEANLRVDQYNTLVTMFNGEPMSQVTARR